MSNPITPTIGRIVYYRGLDAKIRAACIAKVNSIFNVDLNVFPAFANDVDAGFKESVTHADPEQEPFSQHSWHWMPYQKQVAAGQIPPVQHAVPENTTQVPKQKKNSVTQDQIDRLLASCELLTAKIGEKTCIATAILTNGFEITETAACVDPANYDQKVGLEICRRKIVNKLWELEGYRLACELADDRTKLPRPIG